jgi:hypothetical protein
VIVTLAAGVACHVGEPRAGNLAAQFEQQRPVFDQLRLMLEADAKRVALREVSLKGDGSARCGADRLGAECLGVERFNAYASVMPRIGVQSVHRESGPERIYFVLYSRGYLMNARLRGVVHTTAPTDQTAAAARREEWKGISGGWYTFLSVD